MQFPLYWFSGPALLKQWFDSVLTHGWAYGRKGEDKLTSRKVALAVSAGVKEEDYSRTGRYHFTLAELLAPFETAFRYCFADYRQFFALYEAEAENDDTYALTGDEIEESVRGYLKFLDTLAGESVLSAPEALFCCGTGLR